MNIEDLIKRHEGLQLKPYQDSMGTLTIGYGRNLDDRGITQGEAYMMLLHDLAWVEGDLVNAFPWFANLNPVRQDVLRDMCFNMGIYRLQGFVHMLGAIMAQNWQVASDEMLKSRWAVQVGKRSEELASMMRTGQYGTFA